MTHAKNFSTAGAFSLLALMAAAAQAQVVTFVGSPTDPTKPIQVNDNFYGMGYGQDGYVLYDPVYAPSGGNFYQAGNDPLNDPKTLKTLPTYLTVASAPDQANSGAEYNYNYSNITQASGPFTQALRAGLGGTGTGGAHDLVTFTVAAGAPAVFQIGVLANFGDSTGDLPASFTFTGPSSGPLDTATAAVTNQTKTGNLYLFDIAGASAGQVFTLSANGTVNTKTLYSGLTFDSLATPAPEPSQTAGLGLGILGLTGLALTARRKRAAQNS